MNEDPVSLHVGRGGVLGVVWVDCCEVSAIERRTRRLSRGRREGETAVADGPRMTVADVVADR
jgi:hypothetical protein